jgi:ATP-binding cassette subfamily B protein
MLIAKLILKNRKIKVFDLMLFNDYICLGIERKTGIFRLLEIAGSKKWLIIIACIIGILATCFQFSPYILVYFGVMELVEHIGDLSGVSSSYVKTIALLMIGCFLCYAVFTYISLVLSHVAAFNILYEIRMKLAEKLSRLGLGYFTNSTAGAVKQVLNEDVENIELFVAHHTVDLTSSILVPIITLIVMGVIDWRLMLVSLMPPVIGLFLYVREFMSPKSQAYMKEYYDAMATMGGHAVEYVNGIQVLKIFNQANVGIARFINSIKKHSVLVRQWYASYTFSYASFLTCIGSPLVFALPLGVILSFFIDYKIFIPKLFFFLVVGGCLNMPLNKLLFISSSMSRVVEGVKRIDSILYADELFQSNKIAEPLDNSIEFDNVSFSYGDRQILKGISFRVEPGEFVGIVGPSGGGKTTMVQLAVRFWDVQEGVVRIGGVDIKDISTETLMKNISFVFQDVYLFRDTIENNIRMGNSTATMEDVQRAARAVQAEEFILKTPDGYKSIIGENNVHFSGGEAQRISIARAILKNAPIIILDEATAFSDADNEVKIQKAFAELTRGKTVLVIAHRMSSIQLADNILVVENGSIVQKGKHSTLVNDKMGLYNRLVEAYNKSKDWTLNPNEGKLLEKSTLNNLQFLDESNSVPSQIPERNYIRMLIPMFIWALIATVLQCLPFSVALMVVIEYYNALKNGESVRTSYVVIMAVAVVVIPIVYYFVNRAAYVYSYTASENIVENGRLNLAIHMKNLSMGFFNLRGTGDLSLMMTHDFENVEALVAHLLSQFVCGIVFPVICIICLLFFDWRLALIIAAVIILSVPLVLLSRYLIMWIGTKHHKILNEANSRLLEYILGIKPIKSFSIGGAKFHTLEKAAKKLKKVSLQQEAIMGPSVCLAGVFLHGVLPVVMLVGTWFMLKGTLNSEILLIFIIISMRICDPLMLSLVYLIDMMYYLISVRRIRDTMAEKPLPETEKTIVGSGFDIRFENVNFAYKDKQVLFNINCEMKHGSLTALVGCSGSGKSTLTRLIARFWDSDSGTVSIGGVSVKDIKTEQLLSQISVVFQDVYLFHDTIANNISIGHPNATREEIEAAAKAAHLHDFIMKLPDKYDTMVGEGGSMLSGGEKQRVSIARAILKNASIILLDEAASSLDAENEVLLQEALSYLVAKKTLIVIAHRLQSIMNADHIIVLSEGKIVEEGKHCDLISLNGTYARMWDQQQKAKGWKFIERESEPS